MKELAEGLGQQGIAATLEHGVRISTRPIHSELCADIGP